MAKHRMIIPNSRVMHPDMGKGILREKCMSAVTAYQYVELVDIDQEWGKLSARYSEVGWDELG